MDDAQLKRLPPDVAEKMLADEIEQALGVLNHAMSQASLLGLKVEIEAREGRSIPDRLGYGVRQWVEFPRVKVRVYRAIRPFESDTAAARPEAAEHD